MHWFVELSFVISCCFVTITYGFATKESYSTNIIMKNVKLIDFGDTKFHDIQAITAICITQYRYLKRNKINLPLPPEPKPYDLCPYSQLFNGDINAIKVAKKAMYNFVEAVTEPDSCMLEFWHNKVTNPSYHYDAEEKLSDTNKRVIQRRINAFKEYQKWDGQYDWNYGNIVNYLGNNIHSVQDFYSHTNWVEMGNRDINLNVGLNGDFGIPILPGSATSCTTCTLNDMTPAERKIYDTFVENHLSRLMFGSIPCLKGSSSYVFACRNNTATNGLTSGYYGSEAKTAPKPDTGKKCSHGGGFDESDVINAVGGISKDADTLFLAPHYYLHKEAARLSVKATIQYLEDFRLSMNDEKKFGQLIGIQSEPAAGIAIVLDTTASMNCKYKWNNVIDQVLDDIEEFGRQNPSKTINYFLMVFNDPDFGFPSEDGGVYRTNSSTDFIQKLNSLSPSGGGDTPEMCLPAILSTLKKVDPGAFVNVYTDSVSKKPEFLQQIGGIAVGKNIRISFTMFGENIPNPGNSSNHFGNVLGLRSSRYMKMVNTDESTNSSEYSTIQDYINLSMLTNGEYIRYEKEGQKQILSPKTNSQNDLEIIDSVYIEHVTAFNYEFIVDDTMPSIEIELTLLLGGDSIHNLNLNISSPISVLPPNETFTTDSVRKFSYNSPTSGKWTVNITNINITQMILLKVQSPSYMDARIQIFPSLSTNLSRAPIIGEGKYDIFIECSSCETVDNLIITPCGNETKYIEQIPIYVDGFNWWYLESVPFPPAGGLICFEINGTTSRNISFTRVVDKKITLSSIGIRGNVSDSEIFNHQNASITFYITNYGVSDNFSLSIEKNKNINLTFSDKIYVIDSKATVQDTVEIYITDHYVTSIDVELTVTAQSKPSITVQQKFFISVLSSDDDVAAPICNILVDGNSTCPEHCVGQQYNVEVEYYDFGTGISRAVSEEGEWIIPDVKSNISKYHATGKLDCCTAVSKFFVFDKNGLIGRCIFNNYVKYVTTPSPSTLTASTTTVVPVTSISSMHSVSEFLFVVLPICKIMSFLISFC